MRFNYPLIIRADANAAIGTGHVMRCLALGQRWLEVAGNTMLITVGKYESLGKRLEGDGIETVCIHAYPGSAIDAKETSEIARQAGAKWIAVDGYHFGADYQREIKNAGLSLLFIDDYGHAGQYFADFVLNQNKSASEQFYVKRLPNTQLLIGNKYVLLRKEFGIRRLWKRDITEIAQRVLVTMGGGDPSNTTQKVVDALKSLHDKTLEVKVVIGPYRSFCDALENSLRTANFKSELLSNVNDMPGLMAWADIAVTAAGSTTWETAFMGLPNITLATADNQQTIAECLHSEGVSINLGWHGAVKSDEIATAVSAVVRNRQLRSDMSAKGRALIDGLGSDRVVSAMMGSILTLREVEEDDCELLLRWVNDNDVRKASFNSSPIHPEDHRKWFLAKLHDSSCVFFVALDSGGLPVGQIRFDCYGDTANIDVSVAREQRGKGYGHAVISAGVENLLKNRNITKICALVKNDNQTSLGAFRAAGFVQEGTTSINGCKTVQMMWGANG